MGQRQHITDHDLLIRIDERVSKLDRCMSNHLRHHWVVTAAALTALLDCRGSKSSIERDVCSAGQKARAFHRQAPGIRVRVLGVDGTGAAMAGRDAGVLFLVGLEGRLIGVEPLHEAQTAQVRRHVQRVLWEVGAEELRTDEHSVYEGIVPEGEHRLCLTHWRKSKGKRAYDLRRQAVAEGRPLEVENIQRLLELLRLKPRTAAA